MDIVSSAKGTSKSGPKNDETAPPEAYLEHMVLAMGGVHDSIKGARCASSWYLDWLRGSLSFFPEVWTGRLYRIWRL